MSSAACDMAPPAMLAIMTAIERVQKFMTASLTVHLFRCGLCRFLKVGPVRA
jgi:hypothetical protein